MHGNPSTGQHSAGRRAIPRLAMFNDIAGFGRCSTTVSLPVISAMQVQVCPVPASILSNHLGYPVCYFDDYTSHLREYLDVWRQLGLSFDGLYCGFLGNVRQIGIVEEFLRDFGPGRFLLDPVMGDHGRPYSTVTPEHCSRLKQLLERADIITPNLTEACLLTDTPYREGTWSDSEVRLLCEKLSRLCPGRIVITGLQDGDNFINYILQDGAYTSCVTRRTGQSRPGTGDLFASILAADAINGTPLDDSVQKAADFVALCIRGSEEADVPPQEGVIFEKYLGRLIPPRFPSEIP